MIKPQKNQLIAQLFYLYIDLVIKHNFKQVKFNTVEFNQNESILLLSNHCSWWDGFILYHVNKKLFKKTFYIMVIEETMQKVSFFKYLGAFSVVKNSRQMMQSLDYAAALLNNPENMVVIFPQGQLYSNFIDEVKFEKGLFRIISQVKGRFQYMFAAHFTENFNFQKPSVNIYLKTNPAALNGNELQNAYQQHYNWAKQQQTQIVV